jgi:hypothetical protein
VGVVSDRVEVEERDVQSGRVFLDEREVRRFDWCGHKDEGVGCQDFVFREEGLDWLLYVLASFSM